MAIIAVDFDGTLTTDNKDWIPNAGIRYPGDPNHEIINIVRELHKRGHHIMIYSVRCNILLQRDHPHFHDIFGRMVEWLHEHSVPVSSYYNGFGKPLVDYFLDDRNFTLENARSLLEVCK